MLHNPNSNARLKRLKPRQRKKLRVGEYTELGFSLIVCNAARILSPVCTLFGTGA